MGHAEAVLQKGVDMRHLRRLFRLKLLRDQARPGASKIEGGACPTFLHYVLRTGPTEGLILLVASFALV